MRPLRQAPRASGTRGGWDTELGKQEGAGAHGVVGGEQGRGWRFILKPTGRGEIPSAVLLNRAVRSAGLDARRVEDGVRSREREEFRLTFRVRAKGKVGRGAVFKNSRVLEIPSTQLLL